MSFTDLFRINELKARIAKLEDEKADLQKLLTPEMKEAQKIQERISELNEEVIELNNDISKKNIVLEELNIKSNSLGEEIQEKQKQIVTFSDTILVQEFGLYEPRFDFANSTQYKEALKACRHRQAEYVKQFNNESKNVSWTVNNSASKGRQMVSQIARLLMRAYNGECDEIVRKVKSTNIDKSIEQVYKVAKSVNRQCTVIGISISDYYASLKEQEVRLAYEYQLQKEKEREEIREAREQEREARKLAQEIAAERKKLEKEKKQYLSAYKDIKIRYQNATDDEKQDIKKRSLELESRLDDIEAAIQDMDYREANERAGFVYVISNIGSFGEGVYKIGMTRRLDPNERIRELGDASVPFNFDVHAMIFCDDAPKLEAALHRTFEDRKVNIVNQRREFFRVTLEEIEEVVKTNYDKTVEFTEIPEAEQYRTSEKLREKGIFTYVR